MKYINIPKKIKIEFLIILVSIILIILFSWIELKFFGVNSYLFFVVFNLNIILLLVILFLVARNSVKLFLDRKRNVGGSRLRIKLVLSFVTLSFIPTILMFLISVKFVQTSVDYWFRNQIDNSLKTALEIGKINYKYIQDELKTTLDKFNKIHFNRYNEKKLIKLTSDFAKQNNIGILILRNDKREIGFIQNDWKKIWYKLKNKIEWESIQKKNEFWINIYSFEGLDYVLGVAPLKKGSVKKYDFIILGIKLKYPITEKMEKIVQGFYEYNQLKSLKKPLKTSLYILLGVMTLLIIFGSIWFGLKLAKEISYPIQALSYATKRIALGDLEVRIEDESEDELGSLVKSFNLMAEELKRSQRRLNETNQLLSRKNKELEHRRQYMEAVLNTITSGVISLDSQFKINTINKSALDILQIPEGNIVGKGLFDVLPRDCKDKFSSLLLKLEKYPHKVIQTQLTISVEKKERKLLLNLVSLKRHENEQVGTIIVFEDITELDKMQRLAAWQEVARRIAHEIKNPLTPIKLSAQRLEKKFSNLIDDPVFKEGVRVIVRQVDHLQSLVKEFSEFAKLPEITPTKNNLQTLIDEIYLLYTTSYPQIMWKKNIDSKIPAFNFDANAIKRVIINLLNNAVEALQKEQNPEIEINCTYDKNFSNVVIEIKDNGPGLSPKEKARIFEPYFSMKKGSTGLGLTIARAIVKEHGGEITANSQKGKGSRFQIILPV